MIQCPVQPNQQTVRNHTQDKDLQALLQKPRYSQGLPLYIYKRQYNLKNYRSDPVLQLKLRQEYIYALLNHFPSNMYLIRRKLCDEDEKQNYCYSLPYSSFLNYYRRKDIPSGYSPMFYMLKYYCTYRKQDRQAAVPYCILPIPSYRGKHNPETYYNRFSIHLR